MNKIICLHGFTQNSTFIEKKIKAIIKSQSSYEIIGINGSVELESNSYGYWCDSLTNPTNISWINIDMSTEKYGLTASINKVTEVYTPNCIIIGFSQGGCFLDYLIKNKIVNPARAIFIGAMPFNCTTDTYISNVKSLHIYGKNDSIITPDQSIKLADCYSNRIIYEHNGKHVIPNNAEFRAIINNFIET